MKPLLACIALLLLLSLSASVLAESIVAHRGESVVLTTDCIINGQLVANYATVALINVDDNTTLLNATNMTQASPGIFVLNYTFGVDGNFLARQDCYFPLNVTAQGSDDVAVSEPLMTFILPGLGILFLFLGTRKKLFTFFAGVCFILTIIITRPDFIISLILFFVTIGCWFDVAKSKKE